jgi:multidrug efflux system membrane fusion protein
MAEHAPIAGNVANPNPTIYGPNDGPRHHWWPWTLAAVLLVGGIILMTVLRDRKPKPPPPPPVPIVATNVAQGDIDVAVTDIGSVLPVATVALSPRVDGQLMEVNYKEGQMVESNQLLAVIDPRPYEALLTETQGQLERDKAQLEVARIDLERYQSAYAKKAIPKQQADDQSAVVHQDEGTVKYDEGQVANAKVQLAYCYMRSPIFGRVGLRLVDPGNVIHAANTNAVVVITQLQPITVVFKLAVDDFTQIK